MPNWNRIGTKIGGGALDGHVCRKCNKLWVSNNTYPDDAYLFVTTYCPNCLPTMTTMTLDPAPPRYKHQPMAGRTPLIRKPIQTQY